MATTFVLALNRVNIVAVTAILALRVGVIGQHVPRHSGFMFPRRLGTITIFFRPDGGSNSISFVIVSNSTVPLLQFEEHLLRTEALLRRLGAPTPSAGSRRPFRSPMGKLSNAMECVLERCGSAFCFDGSS